MGWIFPFLSKWLKLEGCFHYQTHHNQHTHQATRQTNSGLEQAFLLSARQELPVFWLYTPFVHRFVTSFARIAFHPVSEEAELDRTG
jgi:hypothetical protein